MKTVIEVNGNLRLRLQPENAIESAFLLAAAGQSEKGATTILTLPKGDSDEYVLEVGRRE